MQSVSVQFQSNYSKRSQQIQLVIFNSPPFEIMYFYTKFKNCVNIEVFIFVPTQILLLYKLNLNSTGKSVGLK